MNIDQERQLDALGDPTRRAVLRLLRSGPVSVSDIAKEFPISRPAISHHLRLLKEAGLVTDSAVATRRMYELRAEAFRSLEAYFGDFWSASLGEFKKRVETQAKRRRSAL